MIPAPTRFGLIRHAPTLWNRAKRIQGIQDSALSEEGRHLAEKWGQRLAEFAWDGILASELGRARQTAELINRALNVQVTTTGKLREMDWGQWTGQTLKQIKSDSREKLSSMEAAGWRFQPPGGENRRTVLKRGQQALMDAAQDWPGQTILVITHEGMLKALIYGICGRNYLPTEPAILKSGHLHWLASRGSDLSLHALNALDLNGPVL